MLKAVITSALILGTSISTYAQEIKQFPEDNLIYRPRVHTGFTQYRAPSLWGTKKVVLTYDDGPHITNTPKVLDLLAQYGVSATFFVLTENINPQNRHIIDRIVMEGHTLASHDHDHDNNNTESETTYKKELTQTITSIKNILSDLGVAQNQIYYRFPYGAYGTNRAYHHMNVMKEVSQELFNENCINFAFWDIDTADWVSNVTAKDIAQGIRAHMEGGTAYTHKRVTLPDGRRRFRKSAYRISAEKAPKGGVVLMHDIHAKNIESTRMILTEAKEKGWEIVHLNEIKEYKYSPEKNCVLK